MANGVMAMDKKQKEKKYENSIRRMINRWAGVKQENKRGNPNNETVFSRKETLPVKKGRSNIIEPGRTVPVLAECDVLVVGGGPAGLSAALSAKRAGADTILMERYGCFGGVITTVGMETLGWYRYEGTVESEGIGIEMEKLAAKMGGTVKWPYNESECLDADFFKIVADHLIREAGVRPILHCLAVEAIMDKNRIAGVITESKTGRRAILAKRVIDCTGDADIAYLAGAPYRKTAREEMMGVTTVFSCSGVDKKKFLKYTEKNKATYADWSRVWDQETTGKEDFLPSPYLDKEFEKARELGVIPAGTGNIGGTWSALTDAGEATNLNLVHMKGIDCTDVFDLTKAEMEGRAETLHAIAALKKVIPGFERAKLRNFGMTLGCRDSRKIIGRYNLTGEDVRGQGKFADSIGIFPEFLDGYNILILPTTGRYFEVPYGCLLPVGVDNLLVAGRCTAGDKVSHCAMRNMMACTVTGQGAGAAAAVSLKTGSTTGTVDIKKVQEALFEQGVRFH
jgi:ribulose 1,5-bisphosphate synthetase/thiazole synthase